MRMMCRPQGRATGVCLYEPLDLFSGDATRMRKALQALLDDPRSNLALYANGQRLAGGDWDSVLERWAGCAPSKTKQQLADLLTAVLLQSGKTHLPKPCQVVSGSAG